MPKTLRATTSVIVVCAFCAIAPSVALAGTLDQQQPTAGGSGLNAQSTQSVAQTFTAGLSGKLDQVDLHLEKVSNPTAPLSVELRDVSGGLPGSTVLASQSVPASSVPAAPAAAFVSINFPVPAPVAAGTQYAIVAYSANVFPVVYSWSDTSGNPYAAGAVYFAGTAPPTTAWMSVAGVDLAFKTYVTLPPPQTATGQRAAALAKCKKKHSKKARKKCRKKAQLLPI